MSHFSDKSNAHHNHSAAESVAADQQHLLDSQQDLLNYVSQQIRKSHQYLEEVSDSEEAKRRERSRRGGTVPAAAADFRREPVKLDPFPSSSSARAGGGVSGKSVKFDHHHQHHTTAHETAVHIANVRQGKYGGGSLDRDLTTINPTPRVFQEDEDQDQLRRDSSRSRTAAKKSDDPLSRDILRRLSHIEEAVLRNNISGLKEDAKRTHLASLLAGGERGGSTRNISPSRGVHLHPHPDASSSTLTRENQQNRNQLFGSEAEDLKREADRANRSAEANILAAGGGAARPLSPARDSHSAFYPHAYQPAVVPPQHHSLNASHGLGYSSNNISPVRSPTSRGPGGAAPPPQPQPYVPVPIGLGSNTTTTTASSRRSHESDSLLGSVHSIIDALQSQERRIEQRQERRRKSAEQEEEAAAAARSRRGRSRSPRRDTPVAAAAAGYYSTTSVESDLGINNHLPRTQNSPLHSKGSTGLARRVSDLERRLERCEENEEALKIRGATATTTTAAPPDGLNTSHQASQPEQQQEEETAKESSTPTAATMVVEGVRSEVHSLRALTEQHRKWEQDQVARAAPAGRGASQSAGRSPSRDPSLKNPRSSSLSTGTTTTNKPAWRPAGAAASSTATHHNTVNSSSSSAHHNSHSHQRFESKTISPRRSPEPAVGNNTSSTSPFERKDVSPPRRPSSPPAEVSTRTGPPLSSTKNQTNKNSSSSAEDPPRDPLADTQVPTTSNGGLVETVEGAVREVCHDVLKEEVKLAVSSALGNHPLLSPGRRGGALNNNNNTATSEMAPPSAAEDGDDEVHHYHHYYSSGAAGSSAMKNSSPVRPSATSAVPLPMTPPQGPHPNATSAAPIPMSTTTTTTSTAAENAAVAVNAVSTKRRLESPLRNNSSPYPNNSSSTATEEKIRQLEAERLVLQQKSLLQEEQLIHLQRLHAQDVAGSEERRRSASAQSQPAISTSRQPSPPQQQQQAVEQLTNTIQMMLQQQSVENQRLLQMQENSMNALLAQAAQNTGSQKRQSVTTAPPSASIMVAAQQESPKASRKQSTSSSSVYVDPAATNALAKKGNYSGGVGGGLGSYANPQAAPAGGRPGGQYQATSRRTSSVGSGSLNRPPIPAATPPSLTPRQGWNTSVRVQPLPFPTKKLSTTTAAGNRRTSSSSPGYAAKHQAAAAVAQGKDGSHNVSGVSSGGVNNSVIEIASDFRRPTCSSFEKANVIYQKKYLKQLGVNDDDQSRAAAALHHQYHHHRHCQDQTCEVLEETAETAAATRSRSRSASPPSNLAGGQ